MENDIDEYFDLESENVEKKDEIGQKFKILCKTLCYYMFATCRVN